MPEGDTIHRAARSLDRALAGRTLTRFVAPRVPHRPFPDGTRVLGAEARGKHCLVHFDDGRSLHTHMRMTGSWHLYRPGERWRKKAAAARVVLEVGPEEDREGWVAVCFAAPVVDLVRTDEGRSGGDPTAHLGPDLCRPGADLDEALDRLARFSTADREVGDALLDQRIANGVGNVFKCEVCFLHGIDPFTPVGDLDEGQRRALLATSARLLQANAAGSGRRTTYEGALAVYGRRDLPCRRCGTPVAWRPQGAQARGTYWCPSCQRRPDPVDASGGSPGPG